MTKFIVIMIAIFTTIIIYRMGLRNKLGNGFITMHFLLRRVLVKLRRGRKGRTMMKNFHLSHKTMRIH